MNENKKTPQKRGQRPRFYICIATQNSSGETELIKERIYFRDSGQQDVEKSGIWAPAGTEPSAEEAIKLFAEKHGVEPEMVEGLLFDVIGSAAIVPERKTVNLSVQDIRHTTNRWMASFQGHAVIASGLAACTSKTGEKFGANELVYLVFDEDQRDEGGKKIAKPKFGASQPVVRFSSLENPVQESSAS